MKTSISHLPVIVAATAFACLAAEPIAIPWYTIDGGGVMRSTGSDGVFALSGTIGQPDAGAMTGGDFKLTGGFWFETPSGDCNVDGIVSLLDHATLVDCLTGPADIGLRPECECFDFDASQTIDLADLAQIQLGFLSE